MATDRDEQLHEQQRQQQELEEIRRSFAEMGARMGSLFEPAEPTSPAGAAVRAAGPAGRPSGAAAARRAAPLVVGGGAAVPRRRPVRLLRGDGARRPADPAHRGPGGGATGPAGDGHRTETSVPEVCLDTAELGDEVIARLNRNQRDNRLFLALRDYTIASQACRRGHRPDA